MQCMKPKFCFCVLAFFVAFGVTSSLNVFAFDFQRDVASHFFWTDSYKEKHPAPTNNMPKTMAEYYREANKAAEKNSEIPSPKFQRDEKLVD